MGSTTDPSCTTLAELLEAFEREVQKSPLIPVELRDPLSGPATLPNQVGALSLHFWRELTANTDNVRNQTFSEVRDSIVAELQVRLAPKAQKVSRADLHAIEDRVRNRLTNLSFRRLWNVKHLDTRERRTGEYLTIFLRFTAKRLETLGNE